MDDGVPDAAAPVPIILRDVDPAPIFLGDVDSVEEVLESKQDKINILGFMSGFVTPPALFVLLWGVWYIGDFVPWTGDTNFWYWVFMLCSGACIWPTAGVIITITAYKKGNTEEAIGALFAFIFWIFIILIFVSTW
jgi:hypothetical protein